MDKNTQPPETHEHTGLLDAQELELCVNVFLSSVERAMSCLVEKDKPYVLSELSKHSMSRNFQAVFKPNGVTQELDALLKNPIFYRFVNSLTVIFLANLPGGAKSYIALASQLTWAYGVFGRSDAPGKVSLPDDYLEEFMTMTEINELFLENKWLLVLCMIQMYGPTLDVTEPKQTATASASIPDGVLRG